MALHHGIRSNLDQFLQQLLQVWLVGLTLGMMRTVIPALAESDFGVPKNSFVLLSSFVVAFGLVKGVMNFLAGRLSERHGRKKVLLLGWLVALPIPVMIWHAPSWSWIVAATVLLGIHQGLAWSMTQTFPRYPRNVSANPGTWEIFTLMSWRDKRLMALSQAGLVEKFVDVLVWVFYPVFLYQRGVSLPSVGWIIGVYGFVWGGSQLFTGRLSDHLGRHRPNVWGMWICGAGVAMMVLGEGLTWWAVSAGITGFGMALLYPNLSAAVADIAQPAWRGSAIGIYRFWRDLGYGIGALGLGLAAHYSGQMEMAFWFVAVSMFASGSVLAWLGEETHPRLHPDTSTSDPVGPYERR